MAKDIVYYKSSFANNQIPYGLKDGKLVHISEVENGLRCGCVCPKCNAPLEANQGQKRSYFSHKPGYSQCTGAVESTLHLMAKEVLAECKCMYLPQGGPFVGLVYFDKIDVEERDDNSVFRPDCIGYCEGETIWVEFKNTHAVSNEKRKYIIEKGIDCVEVDISKCELDRQKMVLFLTKQIGSREWVKDVITFAPKFAVLQQEESKESFREIEFSAVPTSSVAHSSVSEQTIRYAFDENHNFVDVRRIGREKKLFCLVCGKPIKPKDCWNNEHDCKDRYLRKSAQELLFSKFNNKGPFNIEIQDIKKCEKWNGCKYYDEKRCCSRGEEQKFDIKSLGFTECVKDYIIPGTDKILDLAFITPGNNVIGVEIFENEEDYKAEGNDPSIRLIKILVEKPRDLNVLDFDPLSQRSHKFVGFSSKVDSEHEIPKTNKTFKVFYVTKEGIVYYEDVPSCGLDNIKTRSRYGIVFRRGQRSNDLKYGLFMCKLNEIKVCICEICFHLLSKTKGNGQYYCNRHKTKGTPEYPLDSKPTSCEYFSSNYKLDEQLMREYKYYDIEEFGE